MLNQRFVVKQHEASGDYKFQVWDTELNEWAKGSDPIDSRNEAQTIALNKNSFLALFGR